jgi:ElaB/YqjD/DUF883 family membrane-anchored ribosome-binding protein
MSSAAGPNPTRAGKNPPGTPRSPEELRDDLGELRAELGDTVEELAHRVDVPARVRAKRDEATERVQQQVQHVKEVVAEKAPQVQRQVTTTAQEKPWLVGAAVLAVLALLVQRLRRRGARRGEG